VLPRRDDARIRLLSGAERSKQPIAGHITNHREDPIVLQVHLAALALAAILLAASGCGSSSKTTTTSTSTASTTAAVTSASTEPAKAVVVKVGTGKPLSRAQWLAQGDEVCAQVNAELASKTIKSNAEFAVVLPQAAVYEQGEVEQLVKLVPPRSKTHDWQEFLNETQQWAENSKKLGEKAQGGQFTLAAPLVTTTRKIHEKLAHRAAHDGFKECALV
jgi:hypothetical protein